MPDGAAPDPAEPAAVEPTAPGATEPTAEEWAKRFTYLYSDFENYRRRTDREREALRRQSQADVLRAVLPTVEASERAVEAVQKLPPSDPVRRGVEMLQKSLATFLDQQGVRVVAKPGETFRSDEHEAVGEAKPTEVAPDGTIAAVVQQGYAFPGGLLRPAKVVVARQRTVETQALVKTPPADEESDDLPFLL
ncbi:MAG: nucleotide exchange factor GrpE [Thermoplasmata archaeon]|nr:nucleotide exchange factor GrpE [Thermoplasmata archaeon]